MTEKSNELDQCPKCQSLSATSKAADDGQVYFYCTQANCDFKVLQSKQDMSKTQAKLAKIKAELFSA